MWIEILEQLHSKVAVYYASTWHCTANFVTKFVIDVYVVHLTQTAQSKINEPEAA